MARSRSSAICLGGLCLASLGAAPARAQEALPEVSTSTIWVGTVQYGDFTRELRGPGVIERFGRGFHAHARIAATQARDVDLDQTATVDTRAQKLSGRVVHISDRIENGTLPVVIEITEMTEANLHPGLSVDVRIQVERLEDVLYVERPAFAQAGQSVGVFKLLDDGAAERVRVTWGPSSVDTIVVDDGLELGDRIILSDMSHYDSAEKVRLIE